MQVFCSAVRTKQRKKDGAERFGIKILPCRECVYFLQEKEPGTLCFTKSREKLAREQRKLSTVRKEAELSETEEKVALCHEKIKNQRKDFQHKLSRSLLKDMMGMRGRSEPAGNVRRAASWEKACRIMVWGQFLSMLGQTEERGKHLIKVDRYFASSKICSVCGHKKKNWHCRIE